VGEEPKLGHETIIPVAYDNSYRMVTVSTRSLQAAAVSVHATTMPAITPAAVISARSKHENGGHGAATFRSACQPADWLARR
jgi:hypothetical protein